MPWGRLDDGLHDNGKVWSFSDKAFRVWVYAISFCNKKYLSDPTGALTDDEARALCRLAGASARTVAELVAKRGWDRCAGGYRVHDFEQYGPFLDRTAVARKRRQRARERDSAVAAALINEDSHADVTRDIRVTAGVTAGVTVTHPIPSTHHAASPTEHEEQKQTSGHDSLSVADTSATEKKPTHSAAGRGGAARRRALLVAFEDVDRWRSPANSVELAQRVAAARALLESSPPVTPAEVPRLVERWNEDHDPELCTPMALARNLTQLRGPPARPNGRRRSAVFRDDRTAAQKAAEPVRRWRDLNIRPAGT